MFDRLITPLTADACEAVMADQDATVTAYRASRGWDTPTYPYPVKLAPVAFAQPDLFGAVDYQMPLVPATTSPGAIVGTRAATAYGAMLEADAAGDLLDVRPTAGEFMAATTASEYDGLAARYDRCYCPTMADTCRFNARLVGSRELDRLLSEAEPPAPYMTVSEAAAMTPAQLRDYHRDAIADANGGQWD